MKPISHFSFFTLLVSIAILHSCRKDEMKVETTRMTNLMATSATAGGIIVEPGEGVEQHGHCWDTIANPTINSNKTENGPATKIGSFTSQLTDLKARKRYYIRAYMQTGNQVVYGKDITFTTLDGKISLTTLEVTNVTYNSATSGGDIASVNGDTILSRGICWDTLSTVNLIVKAGFTTDGSGTGRFTSQLTDLIPGKTFYVRAYAINSADTSYATAFLFNTPSGKSMITTLTVSDLTATTAVTGGNITYTGPPITSRGVCYSRLPNPTIEDSITLDGSGTGSYISSLTGLIPNATYYIRAYATNAITTSYGDQLSFLSKGLPELTTAEITHISYWNLTSGGKITRDWGYPITERGVVWSTSENPTLADSKTMDGRDTGSFTSSLPVFEQGGTYYVRAYATNSVATGYGQQVTFNLIDVVELTSPGTGKIWMDRNLKGLFQWGRNSDGHEKWMSATTSILSTSDTPGHGFLIVPPSGSQPYDWRIPQNDNLWQGVNGINNPCPQGFRLPTEAEWKEELQIGISSEWYTHFARYPDYLSLGLNCQRNPGGSPPYDCHNSGYFWSSTVDGTRARGFYISYRSGGMFSHFRTSAHGVRCIKD